jgi:hypothetical protein
MYSVNRKAENAGLINSAAQSRQVKRRRMSIAFSILMLASMGTARAERFDNWIVEDNADIVSAYNKNSSGSLLAYFCEKNSNQCLFAFLPDRLNCKDGTKYNILVNDSVTSAGHLVNCKRTKGFDGYEFADVFENTNLIRKQMLSAANILSIARGRSDGGFNSSSFEMRGFEAAFNTANRLQNGGDRNDGDRRDMNRRDGDRKF